LGWRIRRQILIETEEILVWRKSRLVEEWCTVCAERVPHCRLQDAAIASGMSLLELSGCLQSGSLHHAENSGDWLICINSISKQKSIKGESS
jgi:hypothetical protein